MQVHGLGGNISNVIFKVNNRFIIMMNYKCIFEVIPFDMHT